MCNEDRTVWITFNGEIYNYQDLRVGLLKKGHVFTSNTDTEVIIHGFEEYGEGLFEKLDGMFAFALWDRNEERLYLARDRYGKKPLYYGMAGNDFIFSSEMKSILRHPRVGKE